MCSLLTACPRAPTCHVPVQIRCILHGKMRSSGNMTTELDPATGGATIRWVLSPQSPHLPSPPSPPHLPSPYLPSPAFPSRSAFLFQAPPPFPPFPSFPPQPLGLRSRSLIVPPPPQTILPFLGMEWTHAGPRQNLTCAAEQVCKAGCECKGPLLPNIGLYFAPSLTPFAVQFLVQISKAKGLLTAKDGPGPFGRRADSPALLHCCTVAMLPATTTLGRMERAHTCGRKRVHGTTVRTGSPCPSRALLESDAPPHHRLSSPSCASTRVSTSTHRTTVPPFVR
jgi:hypothetical protein